MSTLPWMNTFRQKFRQKTVMANQKIHVLGQYTLRMPLSIAIIEIANPPRQIPFNRTCELKYGFGTDRVVIQVFWLRVIGPLYVPIGRYCRTTLSLDNITVISESTSGKEDWSSTQYGNMLASFYYGYALFMWIGAVMPQYFGFYSVVSAVGLLSGFLCIIFPFAIHYSYNLGTVLLYYYINN